MATVVDQPVRRQMKAQFVLRMSVAAVLTTIVGFAPTFYLRGYLPMRSDQPPLTPLLLVHGIVGTAWIALFLTQSLLVVLRRVALHKQLGVVGGVLAGVFVLVGMMTAIDALRRNVGPFGMDARTWFIFPLSGTILFGALVAVALARRRSPDTHRRLMLLATISVLNPALGRIVGSYLSVGLTGFLGLTFLLTDLFVVVAALYEIRVRGRMHPALVYGGLAVILVPKLALALGTTPPLLAFAERFR